MKLAGHIRIYCIYMSTILIMHTQMPFHIYKFEHTHTHTHRHTHTHTHTHTHNISTVLASQKRDVVEMMRAPSFSWCPHLTMSSVSWVQTQPGPRNPGYCPSPPLSSLVFSPLPFFKKVFSYVAASVFSLFHFWAKPQLLCPLSALTAKPLAGLSVETLPAYPPSHHHSIHLSLIPPSLHPSIPCQSFLIVMKLISGLSPSGVYVWRAVAAAAGGHHHIYI